MSVAVLCKGDIRDSHPFERTTRLVPSGGKCDPSVPIAPNLWHVAGDQFVLTKIISILGIILMLLHIVRPLGLPGLRKRSHFWRIALVMIAAVIFTALLRDQA